MENKPNSQHSDMHRWLAHKLFNVSNRWLPTRLPSYTLTRIHGTDSIHNCSINIPEQYNSHSAHHRESRNKNSKSTCPPPAQQQIIIRNTKNKKSIYDAHLYYAMYIILLLSSYCQVLPQTIVTKQINEYECQTFLLVQCECQQNVWNVWM